MTPYYHQSNTSTPPPPTPREGNTFPPLRSPLPGHNHIIKREYVEEGRGVFDEDDVELQLSSHSRSRLELGLRILRYCLVLFLGIVIIGTSIHISNVLYQTPVVQHYQVCEGLPPGVPCTSENRAPVDVKYKIDTIRHTSIHVPTYPPGCDEAECLIHQVPGHGAEPIGTATIFSSTTEPEPRFTIVNTPTPAVEPTEPRFTIVDTPTPTSPPICVPPHCHPHHHRLHDEILKDIERELKGLEGGDHSPPICVPPHCHPHHHRLHDEILKEIEREMKGLEEGDQSPPICVPPHCHPHDREPGETPPICVPPHCYPHPPPGHHHDHHHDHGHDHDHHHDHHHGHHHDHHHDHHRDHHHDHHHNHHNHHHNHHHDHHHNPKEGNIVKEDIPLPCHPPHCYPPPIQVNDKSPPICVPRHCNPHSQDINDQLEKEEQQDNPRICSEVGCTPNILPGRPTPECVPPACYPSPHPHPESSMQELKQGPVCQGPYCYPPPQQLLSESPPICVPPHCYPSNLPGHEHQPLPKGEDEDRSPLTCVPPHCYPHATDNEDDEGDIEKDPVFTIQTDQEREYEFLSLHPEIITMQDDIRSEQEQMNGDDDKPICMPPICVPPTKSAPIFIPCDEAEEED